MTHHTYEQKNKICPSGFLSQNYIGGQAKNLIIYIKKIYMDEKNTTEL